MELTEQLYKQLEQADAIVIGAGAGLSASAGFTYSGDRFLKYFRDFEEKYQFHDMYSGGFYPFREPEEHWAYWSRFVHCNRYTPDTSRVYRNLLELLEGRDYFVLTTNVDHQFQMSGFDKQRLFYTQGDYGLFQCSVPCCQKTYDNEQSIRSMLAQQRNMRIPTDLIPICPVCKKPMTMNLRSDDRFVQDEGWHQAAARYSRFIREHQDLRLLFLELGVGYNTPGIIKYPFWQMTARCQNGFYACVNDGYADCPEAIGQKSLCINADIGAVLTQLKRHGAARSDSNI